MGVETQEAQLLEDLRLLIELQEIDRELSDIKREKATLPVLVERAAGELRAAEADADEAKKGLEALETKRKNIDAGLTETNDHLLKLKLRTTDIKNNKEYFAHLKEIEDTEKKISGLEDEALTLMDTVKEAQETLAAKESALAEVRAKFEEEKAKIEKSFEEGDRRFAELNDRRTGLTPKLTAKVAGYYDKLVVKYPDSAVVRAERGSCTGCSMMIPPQSFNNVRKGETIIACSNCKRILYYVEP
jgi:uncharacterized protein